MCGVRTKIVTSIEVSTGFANDSPYFKSLVDDTANSGFQIAEVSADKAYLSLNNLNHKRSNVETTFHMIKSKFGERLRSKTETGQINEALAKVLCHNICCVIQSIHELGIEPTFHAEFEPVRKVS